MDQSSAKMAIFRSGVGFENDSFLLPPMHSEKTESKMIQSRDMYLIHGDHDDRPKRAIMINAGGDDAFAENFARMQNAPDAAPHLADIICAALVFDQKKKKCNQFQSG
jgi:hypothetical protein